MKNPAKTIARLGLARLAITRLGFAPTDGRPTHGVADNGPRYAYALDFTVALYNEEEDVAGYLSLEIEKNASFTHTVKYLNRDNTPVDLTGCQAKMQIRAARSSTATLIATLASYPKPLGGPDPWFVGLTIAETDGEIELSLSPSDTASLPVGSYWYDMIVTFPGGEVRRIIEGQVMVDEAVTA